MIKMIFITFGFSFFCWFIMTLFSIKPNAWDLLLLFFTLGEKKLSWVFWILIKDKLLLLKYNFEFLKRRWLPLESFYQLSHAKIENKSYFHYEFGDIGNTIWMFTGWVIKPEMHLFLSCDWNCGQSTFNIASIMGHYPELCIIKPKNWFVL